MFYSRCGIEYVTHFFFLVVSRLASRLVSPSPPFIFSMQGYSNFNLDELSEDLDDSAVGLSPEAFSPCPRRVFQEDLKTSGDYALDLPMPRHQLRSRPPIDFPLHHPTYKHPSSLMSGSTQYSRSNPFTFAPKATSSLGPSSRFPIEDIASLTESELYYNPHYRELRKDYDYNCKVLTTYLGRDLAGPHVAPSTTLVPDIRQSCE